MVVSMPAPSSSATNETTCSVLSGRASTSLCSSSEMMSSPGRSRFSAITARR